MIRLLVLALGWGWISVVAHGAAVSECEEGTAPLRVELLLPLESAQFPQGEALAGGFAEGALAALEHGCDVRLHFVDTTPADRPFFTRWLEVLGREPQLLIGPFLPQHRQELSRLDRVVLPEQTVWLYPGRVEDLPVVTGGRVVPFSVGLYGQLRALLEYAWERGHYAITLLMPQGERGERLGEGVRSIWQGWGGEVVASERYGDRFRDLNPALRRLLRQSGADGFDLLLVVADDARLRMMRPLLSYYGGRQPIYSPAPPVGELGLERDMEGLLYPMQPELLQRPFRRFEVDDFLLELENIGHDLMVMLRQQGMGWVSGDQGYVGRSGALRMVAGELLRTPCLVRIEQGEVQVVSCPEAAAPEGQGEVGSF